MVNNFGRLSPTGRRFGSNSFLHATRHIPSGNLLQPYLFNNSGIHLPAGGNLSESWYTLPATTFQGQRNPEWGMIYPASNDFSRAAITWVRNDIPCPERLFKGGEVLIIVSGLPRPWNRSEDRVYHSSPGHPPPLKPEWRQGISWLTQTFPAPVEILAKTM